MSPISRMDSWWWYLVERLYAIPELPPRKRTKPMEVICVGLPRSGTETLQQALLHLGYDYTYHGWDVLFDSQVYSPAWARLARKKWYGSHDGNSNIEAAEFDEVIGHSVAVTDAVASCFAAELIAAYPDAKVILNTRRDLDAWHRSIQQTLIHSVNDSWSFYFMSIFNKECFWAWHLFERFLWPLQFRAPDGEMASAIRRNGKWVYREHCNMIRGLVPKDKLLEWSPEDGWKPLCGFLGKPVPDIPFPHANAFGGGWDTKMQQTFALWGRGALINFSLILTVVISIIAGIYYQSTLRYIL